MPCMEGPKNAGDEQRKKRAKEERRTRQGRSLGEREREGGVGERERGGGRKRVHWGATVGAEESSCVHSRCNVKALVSCLEQAKT